MARRSRSGVSYADDWSAVANRVKDAAGWKCVRCKHRHEPAAGYTLTVHHLDMDPSNGRWWNLLALCQRCHLSVQARVDLNRPWVMAEHSLWFRPYAAGWYAFRYLGEDLSRPDVERRIDELLDLERLAVLGASS